MRILFLSHRLPYPPDKGDKIRSWNFLLRLARKHTVDVACLADTPEDVTPERLNILRAVCGKVEVVYRPRWKALASSAMAIGRGVPMSLRFFGDRRLQACVTRWLKERRYHAALAHSAPMTQYVPAVPGMVRVADFCDVDSEKWRQYAELAKQPKKWVYRRELETLRSHEGQVANEWSSVVLATEPEAKLFRSFCSWGRVEVVPNGVDAEFFRPAPESGKDVLFTGAMDYFPNVEGVVWFAKDVWPLVRAQKPDAKFVIVGPRPAESVRALHDPSKGIEVRGRVPDVRDAIAASSVSVAPLRIARGIQNKVLEAMASVRPVVATSAAAEGIEAMPGRDLVVADEAKAFAMEVVALLGDPERRRRIGVRARAAVLASHSWDVHGLALEKLLEPPRPAAIPRPMTTGVEGQASP
jgi:sugar transferase (PEP-CTERM/EpsH1 system associated)